MAKARSRADDDRSGLERQAIREAMQRLIDGTPIRSDGKLTVKSLADEAGVKRWLLTQKHVDLQQEFRARVAGIDATPEPVRRLKEKLQEVGEQKANLRTDLNNAKADIERYARLVNVLILEKLKLEQVVRDLTRRLAGNEESGIGN